ncbi:MAG: hypothetical protein V4649_11900 [Bacteroidota bacterium]
MKKILLYFMCGMLPLLLMVSGCKKVLHSNNPIPTNYRVLSYTKTTNNQVGLPFPIVNRTIVDNYRFYYDKDNLVVRIVYTTNDTARANRSMDIYFTYTKNKDTVIKTYKDLRTNGLVKVDTFVMNAAKLVTYAYTKGLYKSREKTSYEYFGQLLARTQKSAYNADTTYRNKRSSIEGPSTTYTSVNGDWLKHTYENKLTAHYFKDSLGRYNPDPAMLRNDSIVYANYHATDDVTTSATYTLGAATTRNAPGWDDIISGNYNQGSLYAIVENSRDSFDTVGYIGSLGYLGSIFYNESYAFYTTMAQRPGDYLQLESFTQFGTNIYRNGHLVKQIFGAKGTMDIVYTIDSYSKITQMITTTTDQYLNKFWSTYDLQYEVFQY